MQHQRWIFLVLFFDLIRQQSLLSEWPLVNEVDYFACRKTKL